MRALVLTCDAPNQVALVHRLRERIEIAGVVVSANQTGPGGGNVLRKVGRAVANRTVGRPFVTAWFGMQDHYAGIYGSEFPAELRTFSVAEINDPATIAAIAETSPDLLVVSGTNLVRDAVIAAMDGRPGILNLHTGLSPYVRGGPNCTNWCLATGWFHLIGNTVMWLDEGIDTGAIVTTEQTRLTGTEDLTDLHVKVMDHAHDLLGRATAVVAASGPAPHVPQREIGEGRTFYTREWNALAMARARVRFARQFDPGALKPGHGTQPTLVRLPT